MKKINILVAAFIILVGVSVFALPEKSEAYFGVGVNVGSNNYNNGYGYGGYGYDNYGYGGNYGSNNYGYGSNYYGGGYNSSPYYGGGYGGYYQNPMFTNSVYPSKRVTISGYPYLNGGYSGVPNDYVSFTGPKFFYPQCGSYYCN
jgi:hypothetical protein